MVNDVPLHRRTLHNQRLDAALEQIKHAGVTLDAEKCEFIHSKATFLGHIAEVGFNLNKRRSKSSKP